MRLIDADEVKKRFPIMENDFGMVFNENLHRDLDEIPTVEAILKSEYEQRLKADMAAMLEDLRLEIEEMEHCITSFSNDTYISYNDTWQKIQEYINALGGGKNDK